jgi:hypothetical protein
MAVKPYIIPIKVVLTANAPGVLSYTVNPGETVTVQHWLWSSTGAFSIFGLSISNTEFITNANQSTPILSTFLQQIATANLNHRDFDVPWVVPQTQQIVISVLDTSGAGNTVNVLLWGSREL